LNTRTEHRHTHPAPGVQNPLFHSDPRNFT
jgi:hypothetical protein